MRERVKGVLSAAFAVGLASTVLAPSTAKAWLFEEHANIGRYAVTHLEAREATMLDSLWASVRNSSPAAQRALCKNGRKDASHDRMHDPNWKCVDFGALAAAAADHSCSPTDLLAVVTGSSWFPDVYADVAETEFALHKKDATDGSRVDAWHQGNLDLLRQDPAYLARAAKNSAHFVLGRGSEDDVASFLRRAADQGTPINATASYATYHLAALASAAKLAKLTVGADGYAAVAEAVLAEEAFALHFLEDSFAAGHFVGLSPDAIGSQPERAGTHDYYCEHGLEARTWGAGRISYAAHGDAFMTEKEHDIDKGPLRDREMAARAVQASIRQVLDVAAGDPLPASVDPSADSLAIKDVCSEAVVSGEAATMIQLGTPVLTDVLDLTPEPYRQDPALPHFRSEFGFLVRGAAAGRVGAASGGDYDPSAARGPRFQGATQVGLGAGLGIAGLTTQATDGVFYLEGNVISYGEERYLGRECGSCRAPAGRIGWGVRARVPFWLVPGDTVIGLLVLGLTDRDDLMNMAISASQGSVWWGFERVRPLGEAFSWQIVFGRELALYSSQNSSLAGFHMLQLELPVLEIRTKHQFSGHIGSDALLQIGATAEWDKLGRDAGPSRLTHSGTVFLRLALDGIYYP
jgi:hypothetical protein